MAIDSENGFQIESVKYHIEYFEGGETLSELK
jgi:hypothetical protein